MHSIYNVPHILYIRTGTSGNREVESFLNEANVMKHLSAQKCEYIVQLVGVQVEQAPAMIAMELAPGGNLLDILKSSWMMVSVTHTHTHSSLDVTCICWNTMPVVHCTGRRRGLCIL